MNYVWWFANQMAWMASDAFESWMRSLNVHIKSQMPYKLVRLEAPLN